MRVPWNGSDTKYFESLRSLNFCVARLYLSVAYANDKKGTREHTEG